jgi:bifunctional DNA-binding transcriptional regulator/antitoxin component of YhaV-PrlF toxin-antitoxin module
MTSTPGSSDNGFEVVVGSDGSLAVPAAELARHGIRPGARLRLVVVKDDAEPAPKRRSVRGSLAHLVTPADVEAIEAALAEAKAARIDRL